MATTAISICDHHHLEMKKITWKEIEEKITKAYFIKPAEEGIKQLRVLIDLVQYPAQKLIILMYLIEKQLVWNYESIWDNVTSNVWKSCADDFFRILGILFKYPNITIHPELELVMDKPNYQDKEPDFDGPIQLPGDLVRLLLEGLSFQFHDSLKHIRPLDPEYRQRLQEEEPTLILLCLNLMDYFEQTKAFHAAAQVAFQLLSLLYYKSQVDYDQLLRKLQLVQLTETETSEPHDNNDDEEHQTVDVVDQGHTNPSPFVTPMVFSRRHSFPKDSRILIHKLVNLVCKYGGDENIKLIAMLYDIYHLAIIDQFQDSFRAMTNFLDKVQDVNSEYLIEFNRALAQLGLCAFRVGCIAEASIYLCWLYGFGRVNELLGQTVSYIPYEDRGPTPAGLNEFISYHKRINLELLEAVLQVCAIFPEDPNVAAITHVSKGKFISEEISSLFQSSESEVSRGLPKRVCEFVSDASRDLRKGDFQKAFMVIESLELPKLLSNRVDVLEMLKTKIKEEALRNQHSLSISTSDQLIHKPFEIHIPIA